MNNRQRAVLIAVVAALIAMLIYPPFYIELATESRRLTQTHYAFLFGQAFHTGRVDVWLLFAQWLAALAAGAVAYVLLGPKK